MKLALLLLAFALGLIPVLEAPLAGASAAVQAAPTNLPAPGPGGVSAAADRPLIVVEGPAARQPTSSPWFDWSVLVPVALALLTIGGAYWNNVRLESRKARIAYTNDQLKDLYGPLYSLSRASAAAWLCFRARYRPRGAFFRARPPPTPTELAAWRDWMTGVFMPMNEAMVKAIVGHAHLIDEPGMPTSFVELIAHVEAYRVILEKWRREDFSEHTSVLNFPEDFRDDVERTFNRLRTRQRLLMGSGKLEKLRR